MKELNFDELKIEIRKAKKCELNKVCNFFDIELCKVSEQKEKILKMIGIEYDRYLKMDTLYMCQKLNNKIYEIMKG